MKGHTLRDLLRRLTVRPLGKDGAVTKGRGTRRSNEPPRFAYELLLCENFEAVLDGSGEHITTMEAVRIALDRGRMLIQARGGAGKSVTLDRIAIDASKQGVRVIRIWAVDWANAVAGRGEAVDSGSLLAALGEVSQPPSHPSVFGDQVETLLLVDGLNEVQGPYVQELLIAIDAMATRYPQLGIVVADRLARRRIALSKWQLSTLSPVPDWQVRELLGDAYVTATSSLFANPYFLERARQDPASIATHRFFTQQLSLDPSSLANLASAVNQAYHERKDRLVDLAWLEDAAGTETVSRLVEAGVLQRLNGDARFAHHLLSDFLAANNLALHPDRWTREEFDALTFTASSFDALPLLLDQIAPASADLLVRRVHDWNLYAAAYLIADDDQRGRIVSADMRLALLAMLAERRFDRLRTTAQQVTDALRLQRSEIAAKFLDASSPSAVIEIVATSSGVEPWFAEWQALFIRTSGEVIDADLNLLKNPDSVLGWTAANVLKRLSFSTELVSSTVGLLDDDNPTVRWRTAHVLGSLDSSEVVNALLSSTASDEDLWVRYGAIRSLIEIARSAEPDARGTIFVRLGSMAEEISAAPQLTGEIARALRVIAPPPGWAEDAGLLIEQLWANGRSVAEQDLWREVSASLQQQEAAS